MYEKSRETRHFLIFPYPEETELAPSRATELARERQDEENGFNGSRCVYNGWRQDAKKEILGWQSSWPRAGGSASELDA